ncbi:transmembrane signal receptor [Lithospermum erythrorhizon]|uniref:Transmembrane signal receptor n=1 Tax=Lithospermum erythrorhizon TaxID=34254 RepID=A0AAV3QHV8_LITER
MMNCWRFRLLPPAYGGHGPVGQPYRGAPRVVEPAPPQPGGEQAEVVVEQRCEMETDESSQAPMSLWVEFSFSLEHPIFLASVTTGVEPRSFKEAMQDPGWREAMHTEIRALESKETWTLKTLPVGKKALGSRWIYRVKHRSDSTVERLKARLVVFGNHQVERIDYSDTFAPVGKMVTVRVFLAVTAAKNWELHQMDVHNAFLHRDLIEEVYMKIPPGFENGRDG